MRQHGMGAARISVYPILIFVSKVLPVAHRFEIINWLSHAISTALQEPLRERSDTDLGRDTRVRNLLVARQKEYYKRGAFNDACVERNE